MKRKTNQSSLGMKMKKQILYCGLVFFILLMSYPKLTGIHPVTEILEKPVVSQKIEPILLEQMKQVNEDETLGVIVATKGKIDSDLIIRLEAGVGKLDIKQTFTVYPALEIHATSAQIEALAAESVVTALVWGDLELELCMDQAQAYSHTDVLRSSSSYPDYNVNGSGITVALIDSGIWTGHNDLDDGQVIAFKDIHDDGANDDLDDSDGIDGIDDDGHGTAMAAIIAGSGDGNESLIGLAPGASLVGVRARTYADSLASMNWISQNIEEYGIDIVSISQGAGRDVFYYGDDTNSSDILARTADKLVTDYGLIVVAAVGNDGVSHPTLEPASGNYTIGVGAVRDPSEEGWCLWDDVSYRGSHSGPVNYQDITGYPDWYSPDVLAPGVGIKTANISGSNDYEEFTGTSPATAFVSGMIALYLEYNADLANDTDGDGYPDIKQLLWASAVDVPGDTTGGIDGAYGAGRVDGLAGLNFYTKDVSSSKGTAQLVTYWYERNNEPMWRLDPSSCEDWYIYDDIVSNNFSISVSCDPDLMVEVILYKGNTSVADDESTDRGDDCSIFYTGTAGIYYVCIRLISSSGPMGFPGDYYDIEIAITSA